MNQILRDPPVLSRVLKILGWKGIVSGRMPSLMQEASTAYNVLSDPQKRQKYDLRGFSGINAADRDLQVQRHHFVIVTCQGPSKNLAIMQQIL